MAYRRQIPLWMDRNFKIAVIIIAAFLISITITFAGIAAAIVTVIGA